MTVALYRSLPNTEIYVAYSDDNLVGPIEIPFWTPSVASIPNQNSREARKNREKKKTLFINYLLINLIKTLKQQKRQNSLLINFVLLLISTKENIPKLGKFRHYFSFQYDPIYVKKNRRKIGKLLSSGSTFPSEETPPRTKSERSERSATGGGQRLRFPRWIRHVNGAELYTHTLPVGNRYTATDNRQSRGEAKVAKKRLTRPDFRNPRSAWPA